MNNFPSCALTVLCMYMATSNKLYRLRVFCHRELDPTGSSPTTPG